MYKFELTQQEVQVISEALGNMPYKFVAGVVAKMQIQIAAQETDLNKPVVEDSVA